MVCPQCGSSNAAAARFCSSCGAYSAFGGIGIAYSIDENTDNMLVKNASGPSARAGVCAGDQITAINSQPIKDIIAGVPIDVQQARIQKLLRGDPGTRVALTILRDGAVLPPITITRAEIRSAPADAHNGGAVGAFSRWAQAAFSERKRQAEPALYLAAVAGALFMFISFIFLAIKIERDVRAFVQRSREDRRT